MKAKNNKDYEQILKDYVEQKKTLQEFLLNYIDNPDFADSNFNDLQQIIKEQKILKHLNEFRHFLRLILNISNNHHREPDFFNKIERILKTIEKEMKAKFKNIEIFHIFKSNKKIVLFLIKSKIIEIDESIIREMINFEKDKIPRYFHFFIPELLKKSDEKTKQIIEKDIGKMKFDEYYFRRRLEGENDEYLCSLIRADSVIEFISFINKKHISPSSKIVPSIYETNNFLNEKTPTLIEYAAFYGSIQIFQYLLLNNAKLSEHLWEYGIHSNNAEFIHLLENNGIEPSDGTYEKCLEESIKCHHNSISNYINDNLLKTTIDDKNQHQLNSGESSTQLQEIEERKISYGLKYENSKYFPETLNENYIFYYLSKYEYSKLVKTFINMKKNEQRKQQQHRQHTNKNEIINNNSYNNKTLIEESVRKKELFIVYDLLSKTKNICDNLFYDNQQLIEITIPRSIKSIDKCSFYECKNLMRISIPTTVECIGAYAFFGCSSLKEIQIPPTVKSIGKSGFSECSSLIEMIIPTGMSIIEECCFYGCKSLSRLIIPTSITRIERHAFYGCITLKEINIPSSVKLIKQSSFKECSNLFSINFEEPFCIEIIGEGAFERCQHLSQIHIPSTLICIDTKTFSYCSTLTNISIPTSVTSIENSAFNNCSSLSEISIPTSVTSIGNFTFFFCLSLSKVSIPTSVTSIGNFAFSGCLSLKKISIPTSVTSIAKYSFSSCTSLTEISIPTSVTSIGNGAFNDCTSLINISIPTSVTSIGKSAFEKCSSLTNISIPTSVTSIGNSAFSSCTSLKEISIPFSLNADKIGLDPQVKVIKK